MQDSPPKIERKFDEKKPTYDVTEHIELRGDGGAVMPA
jgi:hypothetical protein